MRPRPIAVVGATAAAAIGGAMFIAFKHRQFRCSTDADVQKVFSGAETSVGRAALDARWDTLPVPIQRHLTYAITTAAPPVRTARLRHTGTFRTGPDQRWSPVVGEQYFSACRPGFVWFAGMRVAPLVWIQARDRLVNGRGNMLIKPLSAFTIADASGPEIDQGAALRWLAESVWFPYSLAADTVTWEAIDARSARASVRTAGSSVQAIFEVDADGRIVQLHAERFRDLGGGRSVLTPWSGRYRDYAEFDGFHVPSSVEVTWDLTGGPFCYARFNVTALEYNISQPF
jgi:hypothetical protein